MRHLRIVFLCILLCVSLCVSICAATKEETNTADALYDLGLFKGTSTTDRVYELDKQLNRYEGYALLVRMLGAEDDATAGYTSGKYTYTFKDTIPGWAQKYVAYAQTMGLTKGADDGTFSGDSILNDKMFLTMSLRALGYDESAGDFSWSNVNSFAAEKGLVASNAANAGFDRGDCVFVFWTALNTPSKGSDKTLAAKLVESGAISKAALEKAVETQKNGLSDNKTPTGGFGGATVNPASEQKVCQHTFDTRITKAATCGAAGTSESYCTKCGYVQSTATVPATGNHVHQKTTTTNATCGANGSTVVTCEDCHTVISNTPIPATGKHNYVNGVCTGCGKDKNELPRVSF